MHFTLLTLVAAVLLVAGHAYRSSSALTSVALYCALYSGVTAATLRGRYTPQRKLVFIGSGVILGCACYFLSSYGGRWLGWSTPVKYLVTCAGLGAVSYALLFNRVFRKNLSLPALQWTLPACVLAVSCVFSSGLYIRNIDTLAVAWWFAFSAGLWWEDTRDSRSVAGIH